MEVVASLKLRLSDSADEEPKSVLRKTKTDAEGCAVFSFDLPPGHKYDESEVTVSVASHDLINALPQQLQRIMAYPLVVSRIAEECGPVAGQMMALVKGPQRQQTSVTGDLASGKITLNGTMAVEGEAEL
jgi:hypothetical protein